MVLNLGVAIWTSADVVTLFCSSLDFGRNLDMWYRKVGGLVMSDCKVGSLVMSNCKVGSWLCRIVKWVAEYKRLRTTDLN